MGRRPRVSIPGAFYHVTLRGNHRQPIFFRDNDHDLLDRFVATSLERSRALLHAYCWMSNHLHMLVQVADLPLGRVILRIASAYARTVQLRLDTTGHLFERRYHAEHVDDDRYLLAVVRYIHMNPVEAEITSDPADYAWSSHRAYLGRITNPWLTTSYVLNLLAPNCDAALSAYKRLMGDDQNCFVAHAVNRNASAASTSSLESLFLACCTKYAVTIDLLTSRDRTQHLQSARAWLAHEARQSKVATVCAIARKLKRTEGALRYIMRRYAPAASATNLRDNDPAPDCDQSSPLRAA